MTVTVYHELDPASLETILHTGISRDASGQKTTDDIEKLNAFLDARVPERLRQRGVSRTKVVYAFLAYGGKIIDIATGEAVAVDDFRCGNGMALVRLRVETADCYVSDLDLYDGLKRAKESGTHDSVCNHIADEYWKQVTPLGEFRRDMIARPEIMIVADIAPQAIDVVRKA